MAVSPTTIVDPAADWAAHDAKVREAVVAARGLFTGDGGRSWAYDALRKLADTTRATRTPSQQVTFAAANAVLRGE